MPVSSIIMWFDISIIIVVSQCFVFNILLNCEVNNSHFVGKIPSVTLFPTKSIKKWLGFVLQVNKLNILQKVHIHNQLIVQNYASFP